MKLVKKIAQKMFANLTTDQNISKKPARYHLDQQSRHQVFKIEHF